MVNDEKTRQTQRSYDQLADEYVRRIYGELQHKPLDRQLLDDFAARVKDTGVVGDLGCGPGHVSRYLWERGVEVCGIDLSSELVERARRLNPVLISKKSSSEIHTPKSKRRREPECDRLFKLLRARNRDDHRVRDRLFHQAAAKF